MEKGQSSEVQGVLSREDLMGRFKGGRRCENIWETLLTHLRQVAFIL